MASPCTSSRVEELSRSSRLSSEIEANYDHARRLDREEPGSQLGEDNEMQANVEQPTDGEEIEEGGVEKNKEIEEGGVEKNKEIEAEEEEVEQEEVVEEENEIEEEKEDDSTNRTLRARNSRRAPILLTTRLSRKRPQLDTPTRTPSSKRMRLHDVDELEAQFMSSQPPAMNQSLDSSFWDDWDMKRGSYAPQEKHANRSIKAIRVWRRLASLPSAPSSGRLQQGVSPGRVNTLVKMVLAVANGHAFGALKEAMTFMQQDGRATVAGVFSQDPRVLVSAVDSVDTADNLNSYLRRFALPRLARLYSDTVANRGLLERYKDGSRLSLRTSTNKAYKAEAYVSLIQHIWDVVFPARFRGRNKTRSGLIDSDEPDAIRWNRHRRKLSKQIEAGQRWLKFADKFGWSALGLVTRDWFIEENKVLANDRIFEEILATSEHGTLLDEIEAVKGRFLRQLNKTLGGSLFDLLEDSSRAQRLPLLKLDDHDIMTRPDCDQL
ncbi:hypothetical protein LTR47_011464 [Exophiala xenobiotica]|nr:hypothetical protein LTR92_011310 [Exophiala xenobiotica]KAK5219735.1 hypothetical protein LTR47_011464 [Exophiala xenobiotica]KAK5243946.1 hypothetical protein LTS06_010393 [Exophiala xenobiotica]KAK5311100.1 hypothetical protein LTR93_011830 [Exophiala xenobiotica]KAK5344752.1 hypothetical protein LTR61_011481 [Exophiala xenobiotica]